MAIKYREAEELRATTRKNLTAAPENWMRFLKTASYTYKYSYPDQLLISAQFPNATAVASFDVWSDRFGRRIRKGEKGIGLIDNTGRYPKMRYVFDISQSDRYKDVPQPYVWDLQEEYKNELILSLAGDLSISVEEAVSDFCENTVDSLIEEYENDVVSAAKESAMLDGMDDEAVKTEFRKIVFESVKYMALVRCGLDTSSVDDDVFRNLSAFSEVQITDILGTAVSSISEQALREIETTVKTVERRNQNERNNQEQDNQRNTAPLGRGDEDILSDSERGQADRFDIYSRFRTIRVPAEPDSNAGRERNRNMGRTQTEVSAKSETDTVYADAGQSQPDRSPDLDQRSSRLNDGAVRSGDDGEGRREREAESGRLDGVGTQSELDSEQSRGNRVQQSDKQIKRNRQRKAKQKAEEQKVSPVFSSYEGEQMSMFQSEKTEQDRANEYAMSQLIDHGSAFSDGKFRIQEYFSQEHTRKEKAKFLSDEFGWGGYTGGYTGGIESMDYRPNKGITMTRTDKEHPENNIAVTLTYPQVADMIDQLIADDRYITQKDIENRQNRAIYTLKTNNPDNPNDVPQIEKAKAILDSYNIDYSQLLANQPTVETATPEQIEEMNAAIPDNAELPDINAPSVPAEPEETVYSESAVVAEFRNKTTESFHLINGKTEFDIELEVEERLRQFMTENEIAGEIKGVVLYGSRSRGIEDSEQADIDILVQIDGADMKEYALFNLFEEEFLEIDGIPVDVNPIRPEQTGTLEDFLPKAEAYLEQKQAERTAKIFSSSVGEKEEDDPYLIDNPIVTVDRYNYTIDFNRIGEIRFTREVEEYKGGLDSEGHERRDNYGVSEEYTSFSFSDGYITRYITDSGTDIVTKEQAVEDITEQIHKALTTPDMSIRITDRECNISYLDRESFTITNEAELSLETSDEQKEKMELEAPKDRDALIEEAKKRINDFVVAEYDSESVDFSDLSNIGIAYTTTEDGQHEIQASVDIVNTSIVKRVDGGVISLTKYETLADFVDALNDLDFSDLTYISDEQLQQINERGNSDDDLKITSMTVNFEPEVLEDKVTAEIGFSENRYIDEILNRIIDLTGGVSFAMANALFEYLDEKQHFERLNPAIHAGWFDKTDFIVRAVIDGEEYSYNGRFDIGDGKGTGGGSLIDHISDSVNYTLEPRNPYHLMDEELAEQRKIRDEIIPFLREHEQLTAEEQAILNGIKHDYPIQTTREQYEALIGKTLSHNGQSYTLEKIDFDHLKATVRFNNTADLIRPITTNFSREVSLTTLLEENLDMLLDEQEMFFQNCDLPFLLTKNGLAYDEIEDLSYLFFDENRIDKYPPNDRGSYGNGFLKESQIYELVRRHRNGEDISKELVDGLFGSDTHEARIYFNGDIMEPLDLKVTHTNAGLLVNFGAYSRIVNIGRMGQAYLQRFQDEYEDIRRAEAEEEAQIATKKAVKELGYDFDTETDKFFFTEYGVEEIYYNPDSSEGGQFVISQISHEDILEAETATANIKEVVPRTKAFFEQLEGNSNQTAVDITSDEFGDYVERFNQPFDLEGGYTSTMDDLIERARQQTEQRTETAAPKQEQQLQENITGSYKIYQLRSGEENRYKRFEGLAEQPEPVSISDYELVYNGNLADIDSRNNLNEKLEAIFTKFNTDRPEDFKGHSLSVSDVVVIEQDGKQTAHFVDDVGYQNVPDFFAERAKQTIQEPKHPERENASIETSKEQRIPDIKNLSQLKSSVHEGIEFEITDHLRPECIGEHRIITSVNTIGFTSRKLDENGQPFGNDIHMEWGKSANWSFSENILTSRMNDGEMLMQFHFVARTKVLSDTEKQDADTEVTEQTHEQPEEVKLKSIVVDLQPTKVKANDIKIGDRFEYKGKEYEVTHLHGVYPDDVGVSYIDRSSNGLEYEVTSNIDRYTLANQGKYLGNSQQEENIQQEPENYHITDLMLGQKKPLDKFYDNLAAIKTLKQLEAEDRQATPEEQETLSKYTGWGGLSKAFEPDNNHYPEIREMLTDDEFAAARKSTMTAFYTSPVIIKEMYAKLAEMGFNGGRLLEPSCGIGNFIGMIPDNNINVTGIELDSLTGRIAKKLYPQADIQVCGFENSKLKENSFDAAVGNVPFGEIRVFDKQYNKNNLLIHDYFFSKSLDMVKPGGVVAFITSKGTLDKSDPTARRLLAEKAEFLGAVRLPNNAFKANAGTEVTSDIIFLKKRAEPVVIEPEKEPLWIRTAKDSNGIEMNAYFAHNPKQICGTMKMVSGPYGMESTCEPNKEKKLSEQIRAAMGNIEGTLDTKAVVQNEEMGLEAPKAPESLRNSSYFLSDGKPYFLENGVSEPVTFPKSKAKKSLAILTEMVALRDTVRQLLEMQLDETVSDVQIKAVQDTLSAMYDKFAEKYGRIRDKANADIFKGDSSLPLLKSLERYNENGEYIGKADIFSKRTIKAEHKVTEVATSVDALAVSISAEETKGTVDLDFMSKLTGFDKEKIIDDLQGIIFKIPNTDRYVTADEYLSGNIRKKLETAQQALDNGDTSLSINTKALEKAMPEKLDASSIDFRLGSTWIKPEYIREFVYQLVNTPGWHRKPYSDAMFIDVQYSDVSGVWTITNKSTDKSNVLGKTTYGTAEKTAYDLIEDALNLKATTVKVKVEVDGKERYVVEPTKTAQARAKQEIIMQKFKEWLFADKSRRDDLVETYNRIYNSSRPREFDGSHLNFVGMNPEITLRPHQLNAVARCLYGGNTLLAHEVGAGKSYEMIAAAMEGKRLGLHSKSLICVPNHLTEQIGADFLKLYPNANILIATKRDFEKEHRKELMAKISTGNYDAIIIGHSQLEKIPLSQERQQRYIEEQIEEIVRNIEELKAMRGERYQIKQAEKTKANLETKLQKLLDSPKDDTVTFEELGIDKLIVDEAHLFKNRTKRCA